MGWKAIKEHFKIEHIVHVSDGFIYVGSGHIPKAVQIDQKTGKVSEGEYSSSIVKREFGAIFDASPDLIKELAQAEDKFATSVPVYTYQDGQIIEHQCEVPEWPNVTHDGQIMYENSFRPTKSEIIELAIRDAEAGISLGEDSISRLKQQINQEEKRLKEDRVYLESYLKLKAELVEC